jgi:glycosyltransferase involved in cell wall biosynthesis
VTLLPLLSQEQLWQEFARSTLSVSLSTHDGTPNTLLEAMALGCLPVCGDIESICEWITPGKNGLLVDPTDAQALADAILQGLENVQLQKAAAVTNQKLIAEKAGLETTHTQIVDFYRLCQ